MADSILNRNPEEDEWTDEQFALMLAVRKWKSAQCMACRAQFATEADAELHREGPCGLSVIDRCDERPVN